MGLKEEERRLKQEEAKRKDPLAQKGGNKVTIPRCLRYPGAEEVSAGEQRLLGKAKSTRLKMHPMHRMWCRSEEEAMYVRKVQSFLDHLDWQEDEDSRGGITWLELYVLYSIHGGSKDETEAAKSSKLKRRPMLQKQIADFKKIVRKVKTYAVAEEDAWHLDTSYVQRNRLANAAVTNRQAAVRGMPHVSPEDAETIMLTTLAMRGIVKKKHVDAWKEGCLSITPADIKMQGISGKWRLTATGGEVWNDQTIPIRRLTGTDVTRDKRILGTPPGHEGAYRDQHGYAYQDQPGQGLQYYNMDNGLMVPQSGGVIGF